MHRQNGSRREAGSMGIGEARLQRFDLSGKQNDRSPLREPEGVFSGHGQRRDVVQRGLDRKQDLRAVPGVNALLKGNVRHNSSLITPVLRRNGVTDPVSSEVCETSEDRVFRCLLQSSPDDGVA